MTTELNTQTTDLNIPTTMLTDEIAATIITPTPEPIKEMTQEEIEASLLAEMLDFTNKPKKKSKTKSAKSAKNPPLETITNDDADISAGKAEETCIPRLQVAFNCGYEYNPPNYDYSFLLNRVFDSMPQQQQISRKRLPKQPIIKKAGKKTHWANIYHCAESINRKMEHIQQFVLAELSVTGTVNGTYSLIIQGKYDQLKIESVYKKYIAQYVQCQNCKGLDSIFEKDSITNLPTVKCNGCGSERRVGEIKNGYLATMRGDRKKSRQQT
jgi:translation initiation factor 2 subunit 2